MNIKTGINIHNRFDFVVTNALTGEIEQRGQAENIVLDRIYTRLCNFSSYFDQIVFGTGSGTPTASRTTLFNRVGNKAAVTDELVRAFPTSKWVRKTTLGTEEFNGNILTEIGISDTTTNINTHAMITDAEGNPLSIEKTSLRIIDIYSTVFVTLYDVDTGLKWYSSGLRDYLTGVSAPSNILGISNLFNDEIATITGTRVANVALKKVSISGRFNVDSFNKDVKYLYWTGIGLRCEVPRTGVWEGIQKTAVSLGVGDGTTVKYNLPNLLPNTKLENLQVFVDGVSKNFEYKNMANIILASPPPVASIVTANYKCLYIPKDANHVLDITFEIEFGVGQPTPVMPPNTPPQGVVPGMTVPYAGDSNYGFFGEVVVEDLITGSDLSNFLGLTTGILQNDGIPWLKFKLDGKTLFVAKKPIRHTISWDNINAVNAVYGNRTIEINGLVYKIRLMKSGLVDPMPNIIAACHGSEWNKLMLPIHIQAKDKSWAYPANVESDVPYWGVDYTDKDLLTHSSFGNGSYSWCQETYSSGRVIRGGNGVSNSYSNSSSFSLYISGWRPVLELVA